MRKTAALTCLLCLLNFAARPALVAQAQAGGAAKISQASQPSATALSNEEVLAMWRAGLSAEIIVAKIKSSPARFDTAPATLQQLKAAGLPEPVILAMLEAAARPAAANATTSATTSAAAELVAVTVPDGTPVEVEAAHDILSSNVRAGDALSFRVVRPVMIGGATVIADGALVTGRVVKAKGAGRWGRGGQLAWTMQDVISVDGQLLAVRAADAKQGESNTGEVATRTIVLGALLAPTIVLAPLALMQGFKKGKDAVLPAGARLRVFVQGERTVRAKK